jgi:hypothetical protein
MIKIIQFICFVLIIYIFLISNNLNDLFQSILGRFIIFLFLILITSINKILGIIFACYLLVYFNNVLVNNYIPFHNQNINNVENFSNIYSSKNNSNNLVDYDIITDKINMESYMLPKRSNDLFPFKINIPNKEPKPYS